MQKLQVILHHNNAGLLQYGNGKIELLKYKAEAAAAVNVFSVSCQNVLYLSLEATSEPSNGLNSLAASGSTTQPRPHRKLHIATLAQKGGHLRLLKVDVMVEAAFTEQAEAWVETALQMAYPTTRPKRKVLLIVNPAGGKGKAKSLVSSTVLPILKAAHCQVDVLETTHSKQAIEIGKGMILSYDVVAVASGDGLIHELINGLALRPDARKALLTPLAPIPTGSANGLCINILGVQDTFNIPLACLNVIKGNPLPLDLCAIVRDGKRSWSFMSQAAGLMSDLDLGTEHLRWMGDARFLFGFLRGIASNKPMKCKISMKVVSADKALMIQRLNASRSTGVPKISSSPSAPPAPPPGDGAHSTPENENESEDSLPPIQVLKVDSDWVTFTSGTSYGKGGKTISTGLAPLKGSWKDGEGILYIYAGTMPFVARDLMQFPVATPGEGVIDIVIQSLVPRAVLVGAITGAENGAQYYLDCQHYYKASAFILESLDVDQLVSIDGEAMPFDKFSAQIYPRLARTLSLVAGWADAGFGRS